MRRVWILALLAACSANGAPSVEERIASRRIALGLDRTEPMTFEGAMDALEEKLEPDLKRAALGRLEPTVGLDSALQIASLVRQADLATAGAAREHDPDDFERRMIDAARLADAWARASLGTDAEQTRRDARALLDSCIECHKLYRN